MMNSDDCLKALARHVDRRRHRAAGLFDRVRLARHPAAPAQLPGARRDGARLLARARARARPAGQAGDRARRRRQPADEPRHAGDDRRGRAAQPHPFRLRERHLRGERRPSDPQPRPRRLRRASRAPPAIAACTSSPTCKIFEQQVGAILAEQGPVFVDLKVDAERAAGARLPAPARAGGTRGDQGGVTGTVAPHPAAARRSRRRSTSVASAAAGDRSTRGRLHPKAAGAQSRPPSPPRRHGRRRRRT